MKHTTVARRQKVRQAMLFVSFSLFPVIIYYMSPVLAISGATGNIVTGSIIVFGAQFVASLFVGRLFCGWACPAGGAQEWLRTVQRKPVRGRFVRAVKWIIWIPWVLFLGYLFVASDRPAAIDFTAFTAGGISVVDFQGYIVYYSVLTVFVALSLLLGRRGGCHAICWMAPFMIAGRAIRNLLGWPALRLSTRAESCVSCGSCSSACPMSLPVMAMVKRRRVEHSDCILCGSCVDVCRSSVIRYSFSAGVYSEYAVESRNHDGRKEGSTSQLDRGQSA